MENNTNNRNILSTKAIQNHSRSAKPAEIYLTLSDDEKIDICARRIFDKYRKAFEELAKR